MHLAALVARVVEKRHIVVKVHAVGKRAQKHLCAPNDLRVWRVIERVLLGVDEEDLVFVDRGPLLELGVDVAHQIETRLKLFVVPHTGVARAHLEHLDARIRVQLAVGVECGDQLGGELNVLGQLACNRVCLLAHRHHLDELVLEQELALALGLFLAVAAQLRLKLAVVVDELLLDFLKLGLGVLGCLLLEQLALDLELHHGGLLLVLKVLFELLHFRNHLGIGGRAQANQLGREIGQLLLGQVPVDGQGCIFRVFLGFHRINEDEELVYSHEDAVHVVDLDGSLDGCAVHKGVTGCLRIDHGEHELALDPVDAEMARIDIEALEDMVDGRDAVALAEHGVTGLVHGIVELHGHARVLVQIGEMRDCAVVRVLDIGLLFLLLEAVVDGH
eukprot:comp22415_c0_seq2/m.54667 comp22415_c0_seq2/g.54667  ORF comp22415_c0_seq2/g.54667 comp22415_c0_seq2/m.54667 type:complete len:389 (+) comp22415_c0_seq2:996-2162(+)